MIYTCNRCNGDPCELSAEGEEFPPSFCPFDNKSIEAKWEYKGDKPIEPEERKE